MKLSKIEETHVVYCETDYERKRVIEIAESGGFDKVDENYIFEDNPHVAIYPESKEYQTTSIGAFNDEIKIAAKQFIESNS